MCGQARPRDYLDEGFDVEVRVSEITVMADDHDEGIGIAAEPERGDRLFRKDVALPPADPARPGGCGGVLAHGRLLRVLLECVGAEVRCRECDLRPVSKYGVQASIRGPIAVDDIHQSICGVGAIGALSEQCQ